MILSLTHVLERLERIIVSEAVLDLNNKVYFLFLRNFDAELRIVGCQLIRHWLANFQMDNFIEGKLCNRLYMKDVFFNQ